MAALEAQIAEAALRTQVHGLLTQKREREEADRLLSLSSALAAHTHSLKECVFGSRNLELEVKRGVYVAAALEWLRSTHFGFLDRSHSTVQIKPSLAPCAAGGLGGDQGIYRLGGDQGIL